jgi:hypothetical protein
MAQRTITAAVVVSLSGRIEDGSAAFYEELAKRFPQHSDLFAGYARDCAASKLTIERTYQETITDALEAGYAFEGLVIDESISTPQLAAGAGLAEALATAEALEERAAAFYLDVADRSQALLATIPGAFRRVVKTRARRKVALAALRG